MKLPAFLTSLPSFLPAAASERADAPSTLAAHTALRSPASTCPAGRPAVPGHLGRVLGVVLTVVVFAVVQLLPLQAAAAARRTEEKTHVVVGGQTLRGIAKRFQITVDELREANDLTPGARLKIGTRLVIPVPGGDKNREKSKDSDDDAPAPKKGRKERDERDRDDGAHAGDKATDGRAKHKGAKPEKTDEDSDDAKSSQTGKATKGGKSGRKGKDAKMRPGYVRLVHDGESWEGYVTDKRGRLTPTAKTAFAKLLRSESTGKRHAIQPRLIKLIAEVSDHFDGKSLEIVSGFRPKTKDQHTPHSKHNQGAAMDFHIEGVSNTVLRDFCKGLGDVGVGFYPHSSFVHLDVRDTATYWVDSSGPGEAPHYEASR
jgi:uncharacterized protein YcbK (DUF882 family)